MKIQFQNGKCFSWSFLGWLSEDDIVHFALFDKKKTEEEEDSRNTVWYNGDSFAAHWTVEGHGMLNSTWYGGCNTISTTFLLNMMNYLILELCFNI